MTGVEAIRVVEPVVRNYGPLAFGLVVLLVLWLVVVDPTLARANVQQEKFNEALNGTVSELRAVTDKLTVVTERFERMLAR